MNTDDRLKERINQLKEERRAVILAHNYQIGEVQDIADYVGDSLGLSQQAAETDADVIVFCGVDFMAETAAILAPKKMVLLPEPEAGCPMAAMITADELKEEKSKHQAPAVCYVNTTADVKAECDYCCTSANALKVVESVLEKRIIFAPDKYLGHYISTQTDKDLILWNGFCPTHVKITAQEIESLREKHPGAKVVVHPECTPDVIEVADAVRSTTGICRFAAESDARELIIGTEVGILHRLHKENPQKTFYPASELAVCPNMKLTTLEKVMWVLEDLVHEVKVPEDVASRARGAIQRMIELVEAPNQEITRA